MSEQRAQSKCCCAEMCCCHETELHTSLDQMMFWVNAVVSWSCWRRHFAVNHKVNKESLLTFIKIFFLTNLLLRNNYYIVFCCVWHPLLPGWMEASLLTQRCQSTTLQSIGLPSKPDWALGYLDTLERMDRTGKEVCIPRCHWPAFAECVVL